jgi:hypothetical protein
VSKRKGPKEKPLFFSFVSKEKKQKKTTIYWTVAGAWTPIYVQPHEAIQQKQQQPKPAFSSFLLCQKKRSKRKPLFTGRLPGRGHPFISNPMKPANKSSKNQNQLPAPYLGRSWFFFCYFSFSLKKKSRGFSLLLSFLRKKKEEGKGRRGGEWV